MEVLLLFSDNPEGVDKPELYDMLKELLCVAMDYLHPAMKVETASGGKVTPLSSLLRRCLKKFKQNSDDGKPYYRSGMETMNVPRLDIVIASMSEKQATRRLNCIKRSGYSSSGYQNGAAFLNDVAALCKLFPKEMRKKTGKTSTIKSSLRHATRPEGLEYLMNGCRFAAHHPDIKLMDGTTRNEAHHLQTKFMFRNVMHQIGRNVEIVSGVLTVIKLMAGYLQKDNTFTIIHREHTLLHQVALDLMQTPKEFVPLMDHRPVRNPLIDMESLPRNAKTLRKRPAAAMSAMVKRPAGRT